MANETITGRNIAALAQFADVEIANGIKVKDAQFYIRQEPYWSSAFYQLQTVTAGSIASAPGILAGQSASSVQIFQTKQGQQGQGSASPPTWADTNNEMGTMFDATQAYIGTSMAVSLELVDTTGATVMTQTGGNILHPTDVDQVISACSLLWSKIGGRKRRLGTIDLFPSGTGTYQSGFGGLTAQSIVNGAASATSPYFGIPENGGPSSQTGVLAVPMIFSPMQAYQIDSSFDRSVVFGNTAWLTAGTGSALYLKVRYCLYGYRANLQA